MVSDYPIKSKMSLPTNPAVYMVTVFVKSEKRRRVVYIGRTSCVRQRALYHPVMKLVKNINGVSRIQFLYLDFTPMKRLNGNMENSLINTLRPEFNYSKKKYYIKNGK